MISKNHLIEQEINQLKEELRCCIALSPDGRKDIENRIAYLENQLKEVE